MLHVRPHEFHLAHSRILEIEHLFARPVASHLAHVLPVHPCFSSNWWLGIWSDFASTQSHEGVQYELDKHGVSYLGVSYFADLPQARTYCSTHGGIRYNLGGEKPVPILRSRVQPDSTDRFHPVCNNIYHFQIPRRKQVQLRFCCKWFGLVVPSSEAASCELFRAAANMAALWWQGRRRMGS